MPYSTKRIHFDEFSFDMNDDVYEPAEDSFLFAENLNVASGDLVLDLGTGSGILANVASKNARGVVAVDLNPFAIRCAKGNSKLNGVQDRIAFIQSDLFSAFCDGLRFDLVLFNAPYLPSEAGEESTWIGKAWAGGSNGRLVVDKFIAEVPTYLQPNGRVLLMQSTLTGVEETIQMFNRQKLKASVIAEQQLPFFETLTLIEAKI